VQSLSRSWSEEEDRMLIHWVNLCQQVGLDKKQVFEKTAEKMGKTSSACCERWKQIESTHQETSWISSKKFPNQWEREQKQLKERIDKLETLIESQQKQYETLLKENQKLKGDMKFFEMLLLEEYQLLLKILGKRNHVRIHGF
jgi:predicted  nucleic acid-binding Zn-ribbon protein